MITPETFTPTIEPGDLDAVADLLSEDRIGPRDGDGKTVVVAMSGGVDSAVTALVMRERGYNVVGMNLRLFSPEDEDHRANPCCGIPAMDDARKTCATIGVPFYAINMELEFGANVIQKFIDEYAAGRTPNPCLECNRHVKFQHLVQRARALGADCLATGHYARIEGGQDGEPHRLYRAVDDNKDQSYVLHTLNQDQLSYIQFPLGGLIKPEVRRLAHAFGLPVADKPESQEICFVGNRSYADFVSEHRPDVTAPGEIVNKDGAIVGQHKGLVNHTVGQRRGLGLQAPKPYFVLQLDTSNNKLVVGDREDAESRALSADAISFTSDIWPNEPVRCNVTVRYRGLPYSATIHPGTAEDRSATIVFDNDRGPIASPGQAVVFYADEQVLGGGTISAVERRGA